MPTTLISTEHLKLFGINTLMNNEGEFLVNDKNEKYLRQNNIEFRIKS